MPPRAPRVPPFKFVDPADNPEFDAKLESDLDEVKANGLPHGKQHMANSKIGRTWTTNANAGMNRGAATRKLPSFSEIMATELERDPRDVPPEPTSYKELIVRKFTELAGKGNLMAWIELMNRTEGKVADKLQADVSTAVRVVPWDDEDAGITYLENPGYGEKPETQDPPDVALRTPPALPAPEESGSGDGDGDRDS
jgi:hypothetical protein